MYHLTTSYILLYVITNHSIFNIYFYFVATIVTLCPRDGVTCHGVTRGWWAGVWRAVMASEHHNTSQHSRFQENINLPTWQYAAVCRHTRPEHTTTRSTSLVASIIASFRIKLATSFREDFTITEPLEFKTSKEVLCHLMITGIRQFMS